MAHREELLAAILAVRANANLRRREDVPWADLEAALDCDLTGRSERKSKVRFPDEEGRRTTSAADWLEGLRRAAATGVGLRPVPAAGSEDRPAEVGGTPVDARNLHAFAGTGGVVLAARTPQRLRQFRARIWLPPETTLTRADVLAFVAARATSDDLRDALLWQDKHNLHVTDGEDWSRFVAALRPEHDAELVRTMDRVVHNTRFTRGEAEAWRALRRSRANPDLAWQFDFVRIEDGDGPLETEKVGVQSARLREALVAIEAFAREIGETSWADAFRKALEALDTVAAPEPLRGLFGKAGMSDGAFRLLAASVLADVFGGMGSWNDLSPADGARYDHVSAALFRELMPSLISAVNEGSA